MDIEKKKQVLLLNKKAIEQKKQAIQIKKEAQELEQEKIMLDRVKESRIKMDYLRDNFFKSLGILVFTTLTLISSLFYSYYSYFIYTPPSKFIALDEDNRILEEVDLTQDVMDESLLNQWSNDALKKTLSYNYISFDRHGSEIKEFFSENGYKKFTEVFNNLRLQKKVQAQKAIVEPVIIKPLSVKNVGTVAGGTRKAWMLEGVVILNIHGMKGVERVKYNVNFMVMRTTFKEKRDGIQIERVQLT